MSSVEFGQLRLVHGAFSVASNGDGRLLCNNIGVNLNNHRVVRGRRNCQRGPNAPSSSGGSSGSGSNSGGPAETGSGSSSGSSSSPTSTGGAVSNINVQPSTVGLAAVFGYLLQMLI